MWHRYAVLTIALLSSLTAAPALAQFPQTMPSNTIYGRIGTGASGPGQAISLQRLAEALFASGVTLPSITVSRSPGGYQSYTGAGAVKMMLQAGANEFAADVTRLRSIVNGITFESDVGGILAGISNSGSMFFGSNAAAIYAALSAYTYSSHTPAQLSMNGYLYNSTNGLMGVDWPAFNNDPRVTPVYTLTGASFFATVSDPTVYVGHALVAQARITSTATTLNSGGGFAGGVVNESNNPNFDGYGILGIMNTPPGGLYPRNPAIWALLRGGVVSETSTEGLLTTNEVSNDQYITANATTDVITWTGHLLRAGQPVTFSTTGTLPAPLVAGTKYFVKTTPTTDTLTLSATSGGSTLDITTTGSGTHIGHYLANAFVGVGVNNSTPYNAFKNGVVVGGATDYGVRVGSGDGNASNIEPTYPFAWLRNATGIKAFTVATDGTLAVNANTSAAQTSPAGSTLQLTGINSSNNKLVIDGYAGQAEVVFRRSDTTLASPSAVLSGETIGAVSAIGYTNALSATPSAALEMIAAENFTVSAQGTYATISTTATGGTTRAEAIRILGSQSLAVGSTTDPGIKGAIGFGGSTSGQTILRASATASGTLTLPATTGTLAVTAGSSIPSVATGDVLYASGTNVLAALADVATGNALISGGVGVAASWGKVTSAHLTGTANRLLGLDGSGNGANITLPAAGLSLSAGALSLTNDIGAIEALTGTGFAERTGTDTWAMTGFSGTGNVARVASPTFTGTLSAATISATASATATTFIPTGSSVPTNGIYLPSANTVGIAANSTFVGSFASTNNGVVQFGNKTSAAVANPFQMNFGGTYSSTPGANPKWVLYDDTTNIYGIGLSSSSMDMIVGAGGATNYFVTGTGAVANLNATRFGHVGKIQAFTATATPSGGTTGSCITLGSAGLSICFGTNAPTLTAPKGSIYIRDNGSTTNDRMYINTDGSTGWTAAITAS